MANIQKRITIAAMLFAMVLGLVWLPFATATAYAQDDTVISIYKNHPDDSEPFRTENLFPGDSETKAYLIRVSHKGTVTVHFHADIRDGYEKLAEVLNCKVVLANEQKTLYDGLMRDMPASLSHKISSASGTMTELEYDITVYLATSVGNAYMNQPLVADFRWWVEEHGGGGTPSVPSRPDVPVVPDNPTVPDDNDDTTKPGDPAEPDKPTEPEPPALPGDDTEPDDGELVTPPKTGDNARPFLWLGIMVLSLLAIIILHRRNGYRPDEEQGGSV